MLVELEQVDPQAAAMLSIERMIEIRNSVAVELKGKITNLEAIRLEAFCTTLKDIGKPDPRIFQIAMQKAGCSKEQLLHVGDSLINGVGGAISAGIKCVWLNRARVVNSLGIMADFEIRSLRELLSIV